MYITLHVSSLEILILHSLKCGWECYPFPTSIFVKFKLGSVYPFFFVINLCLFLSSRSNYSGHVCSLSHVNTLRLPYLEHCVHTYMLTWCSRRKKGSLSNFLSAKPGCLLQNLVLFSRIILWKKSCSDSWPRGVMVYFESSRSSRLWFSFWMFIF